MKTLSQGLNAEDRLAHVVAVVQRQLNVDAAYIAEFRGDRQVYRALAGDAASFNMTLSGSLPIEETYGRRMLAGEIPTVIHDTSAEPLVADLPVTRMNQIGAYAAVPVRRPDGELYGVLGCVNHRPGWEMDARAMGLLARLGELIMFDLGEQSQHQELREGILGLVQTGGFDIAYQPILDLRTDRWLGLEALARFPEPFASPDHVFASAARLGLGSELDCAAARRASEILPELGAGQFLAVNASPATLLDLARQVIAGREFQLSKLVVEVTEHAVIDAYAALRYQLAPLREQGLRIAVDDAGAGYASLRHILELRPDFIKLDRWLIDGLADDRGRRVAVSAFVSIARELGSRVIAEGVQRPADLAVIGELGLDAAQGYLLGGPSTDRRTVARWCESGARSGARVNLIHETADDGRPSALTAGAASPESYGRGAVGRELERFELDRRVSQRLEAVGQLAAGIAHEINTPLQYVGDSVSFLKEAVGELVALTGLYRETLYADTPVPVEQRRRAMREAEEQADVDYLCERIPAAFDRTVDGISRVRSIVQAMKRFSHASGTESAPADINDALETTLAVCRNEYKYVAEIELELGELPLVVCNIGELNQVFLNLIINAAQAIEGALDGSGVLGRIMIRTEVVGDQAVIQVADNGPGMPAAVQRRIYEPFFTTKEVGKGTGQGLALALATVQRHSGSLECDSTPGEGTRFTIRLPLAQSTAETTEITMVA